MASLRPGSFILMKLGPSGRNLEMIIIIISQHLILWHFHVRYIHTVSRRTNILVLFPSENVIAHQIDFSVAVFASFGGRHLSNLARSTSHHHITTLSKRTALLGVNSRSTGVSLIEVLIEMNFIVDDFLFVFR